MNQTIIRPIITEKSLKDALKNVYTFAVDVSSNKNQITKKIEELFNVHVKNIKTTILKGKNRTVGRKRKVIKKPDVKKARVELAKGEKIDLFEIGEKK